MMYGPSLSDKQIRHQAGRWMHERLRVPRDKLMQFLTSRSASCACGFSAVTLSALLAGFSLSANANPILSDAQAKKVILEDWTSYEKATQMSDGTELYQYVAEVIPVIPEGEPLTVSLSETPEKAKPPVIRFSFIPRFGCAPIISVVTKILSDDTDEVQDRMSNLLVGIVVSVDGTAVSYPTLVESDAGVFAAHYDTELRRRNTFRVLIEAGNKARIELDGLGEFDYSLKGSKRTISRSKARCESHAI